MNLFTCDDCGKDYPTSSQGLDGKCIFCADNELTESYQNNESDGKKLYLYDWRESPFTIIEDLIHLGGEKQYFYTTDTDGDDYALIVSHEPMTEKQVKAYYQLQIKE